MLLICEFCGKSYQYSRARELIKKNKSCSERCAYFLRKKYNPKIELDSINQARKEAGLKELVKLPRNLKED